VINGLMIVGILVFLFGMSWSLSAYILLPVPLLILWGRLFWKRMRHQYGRWNRAWSALTERTSEALSGIRVVKAFAQEKREVAAFARVNAAARQAGVETEVNREVFFSTMAFLTGHQDHFPMVGGQESARSTLHLADLFRLADQAGLLRDPESAAARMAAVLAVRGVA